MCVVVCIVFMAKIVMLMFVYYFLSVVMIMTQKGTEGAKAAADKVSKFTNNEVNITITECDVCVYVCMYLL